MTPYESWLNSKNDFRGGLTQSESLTQDILNTPTFNSESHRVNEGLERNTRAASAESDPLFLANMDRWGWQQWVKSTRESSEYPHTQGLYKSRSPRQLPGYCSSCSRHK